jgi:hypothetical protein
LARTGAFPNITPSLYPARTPALSLCDFFEFSTIGRRNRFVCSIDFWQLRKKSQTLSEAQDTRLGFVPAQKENPHFSHKTREMGHPLCLGNFWRLLNTDLISADLI